MTGSKPTSTDSGSARRDRRRIYLIRHGAVSYFDAQGNPVVSDDVSLNAEGRRQAQATADALADVPLDRVVTSGLARCVQTARIVVGNRSLEIESHERIREIRSGQWRDLDPALIEQTFVGAFTSVLSRDHRFLEGETFGSLLDRVLPCFGELLDDTTWQQMAIVAHGGVNRAILTEVLGTGLSSFGRLEQDNACVNIVDVDESGRFVVRMINFTPYNAVKQGIVMTTMERLFAQYQTQLADNTAAEQALD